MHLDTLRGYDRRRYPGEIHRPGIHAGDAHIRKVVVKIHRDSL
jgi:hypothetical protein